MTTTQSLTGIITQARMTSTRLPGKVLKEVNGQTLLGYHIERLKKSKLPVFIATTVNSTDDLVCRFAEKHQIQYYRGSEHHVLSRFIEAADHFGLQTIVRVTADCPLIDGNLILQGIETFNRENSKNVYVSNCFPRTFARGFDFEIFSTDALKDAYKNATLESDFEHVTPYLWNNRSGKMKLLNTSQGKDNSRLRITVDTPEDFNLVKTLIEQYHAEKLSYQEIESLLNQHPELVALNSNIDQKKV